jgi:two-component system, NtrC family, response regulator AtoC
MARTVLIVDDEIVLARNLKTYLEWQGMRVVTASEGELALAALASCRPDIVLVDYGLPGMNGLDLIRRIRGSDAAIPIVMFTGQGNAGIAAAARTAGAVAYLAKPAALAEVKRVLERVLQPRAQSELSEC